jgi:hypothetical protein
MEYSVRPHAALPSTHGRLRRCLVALVLVVASLAATAAPASAETTITADQSCVPVSSSGMVKPFYATVTDIPTNYGYLYAVVDDGTTDFPYGSDYHSYGYQFTSGNRGGTAQIYVTNRNQPVAAGATELSLHLVTYDYETYSGYQTVAHSTVPVCERTPTTVSVSVPCIAVNEYRQIQPFDVHVTGADQYDDYYYYYYYNYIYVMAEPDADPQWDGNYYAYGYSYLNPGQTETDVRVQYANYYSVPAGATSVWIKARSSYNLTGMGTPIEVPLCDADPDTDGDGVKDSTDNCTDAPNGDQANADGDEKGDVCDPDDDNDGVGDETDQCGGTDAGATVAADGCADPDGDGKSTAAGDNCPAVGNAGQENQDGDSEGDACDSDRDGDGVPNANDEFPDDIAESNDADDDGRGDNADAFDDDPTEWSDADEDGKGDNSDNCRDDANNDQADLDEDGKGDACDDDIDGDGVVNGEDAFERDPAESKDSDGDGIGDNGDRFPNDANETADTDDDGKGDNSDNCREVANTDQADLDEDGKGDACDEDVDGDGVANDDDNAPRDPNADQQDLDGDGIGDVIDTKVLPRNADMCKKEGWKRFYDGGARFKNQGDCVSFVTTGGKNLPARS